MAHTFLIAFWSVLGVFVVTVAGLLVYCLQFRRVATPTEEEQREAEHSQANPLAAEESFGAKEAVCGVAIGVVATENTTSGTDGAAHSGRSSSCAVEMIPQVPLEPGEVQAFTLDAGQTPPKESGPCVVSVAVQSRSANSPART